MNRISWFQEATRFFSTDKIKARACDSDSQGSLPIYWRFTRILEPVDSSAGVNELQVRLQKRSRSSALLTEVSAVHVCSRSIIDQRYRVLPSVMGFFLSLLEPVPGSVADLFPWRQADSAQKHLSAVTYLLTWQENADPQKKKRKVMKMKIHECVCVQDQDQERVCVCVSECVG